MDKEAEAEILMAVEDIIMSMMDMLDAIRRITLRSDMVKIKDSVFWSAKAELGRIQVALRKATMGYKWKKRP